MGDYTRACAYLDAPEHVRQLLIDHGHERRIVTYARGVRTRRAVNFTLAVFHCVRCNYTVATYPMRLVDVWQENGHG